MVAALWLERGAAGGADERGLVGDRGKRWGCRSIPLRHGQSRSYTANPSASLSHSLPLFRPSPSPARCPLALSTALPFLFPRLLVRAHYSKRPTAFARYLPPKSTRERPSNSAASSRALIRPIPQDPSRGYLLTARLFKQRDTFPSATSQFSPGRSRICLVFPGRCSARGRDRRIQCLPVLLSVFIRRLCFLSHARSPHSDLSISTHRQDRSPLAL